MSNKSKKGKKLSFKDIRKQYATIIAQDVKEDKKLILVVNINILNTSWVSYEVYNDLTSVDPVWSGDSLLEAIDKYNII